MGFYSWLVNKLRIRRASINPGISTKLYTFGAIYEGFYKNYKHDPTPLVWIQYSDAKYTHAINLHYLDQYEKAWFIKTIYMLKKYQQQIDGYTMYKMLKQQNINIVKKAYRVYFTNMCDYRLVSAGITNMEKLCYTSRDPFVAALNKAISPTAISSVPNQVAYSSTELRERIIEAQNTVNLQDRTVSNFGTAPWMRK